LQERTERSHTKQRSLFFARDGGAAAVGAVARRGPRGGPPRRRRGGGRQRAAAAVRADSARRLPAPVVRPGTNLCWGKFDLGTCSLVRSVSSFPSHACTTPFPSLTTCLPPHTATLSVFLSLYHVPTPPSTTPATPCPYFSAQRPRGITRALRRLFTPWPHRAVVRLRGGGFDAAAHLSSAVTYIARKLLVSTLEPIMRKTGF
jgi:hypothetical protein